MSELRFTRENSRGVETEYVLPGRFEVCPRCEGHGTHLTPSIGEHAYSAEEFNETFWEPEDRAEYFRRGGMYDVDCETCRGKRVILVPDEDACRLTLRGRRLLALYEAIELAKAEDAAERRREERYGY